jgi:hypothetical protein
MKSPPLYTIHREKTASSVPALQVVNRVVAEDIPSVSLPVIDPAPDQLTRR